MDFTVSRRSFLASSVALPFGLRSLEEGPAAALWVFLGTDKRPVPRHMTFDPTRRWLLSANQVGSSVTVIAHNARTGKLTRPVQTREVNTPMFVQFI